MGDPSTINTTATGANKIVAALGNAGVQIVEGLIIADVPLLGIPVIKQAWEALFGWMASYFVKASELGVTFTIIDIQVGSEENEMSAALASLVAAEKGGNQDDINKAIQNYITAQKDLISFDGSANPQ